MNPKITFWMRPFATVLDVHGSEFRARDDAGYYRGYIGITENQMQHEMETTIIGIMWG